MSRRDTVPNSNDVFWVSGRASFLNLRTITSEIVLKEKFKQNKMGTMAGNHSEILSEEPKCWPGGSGAELERLRDPSDLPRLAAHPSLPPLARDLGSSPPTVPIWIALCFRGKAAQRSNSHQVLSPRAHQNCRLAPPTRAFPHGDQLCRTERFPSGVLLSPLSMPSGLGKALLFIRRKSRSRGYVFSRVLPSFFSAPGSVCAPVCRAPTSRAAPRDLCPAGSTSGDVAGTAGHRAGTAQGVPPGQEFPAELTCPQGHLAATWCHLCSQTTRPHRRRMIPDTRWHGCADAASPNGSKLICELKTQLQQTEVLCRKGKDKFSALSTMFWKENKQRHQPWG